MAQAKLKQQQWPWTLAKSFKGSTPMGNAFSLTGVCAVTRCATECRHLHTQSSGGASSSRGELQPDTSRVQGSAHGYGQAQNATACERPDQHCVLGASCVMW